MDISVYVASAFSKNNIGGNKAGVVLNEPTLTNTQKMAIAKQLGYAETAFLTESNCADYKLEYFTPKEEIDLCGHATIGTFAILMHLNKIHKSQYTIETNSGVLTITLKDGTIFMEQNQPTFYEVIPPNNLTGCFDLNLLNANYPIQIVSTGLKDILIPIKSEADLYALEPNFEEVKKSVSIMKWSECICILLVMTGLFVGIPLHYLTLMKKLRLGPLMVLWPVIFIKINTCKKNFMYLNKDTHYTLLPRF